MFSENIAKPNLNMQMTQITTGPAAAALGAPLSIPSAGDMGTTIISTQPAKTLTCGCPDALITDTRMIQPAITSAACGAATVNPATAVEAMATPPLPLAPDINLNMMMKSQNVFITGRQPTMQTSMHGSCLMSMTTVGVLPPEKVYISIAP